MQYVGAGRRVAQGRRRRRRRGRRSARHARDADPLGRSRGRWRLPEHDVDRSATSASIPHGSLRVVRQRQDAHMVYPITRTACSSSATTTAASSWRRRPCRIRSASRPRSAMSTTPAVGRAAGRGMRSYRYYTGLLMIVNDENNGDRMGRSRAGAIASRFDFNERERERIDRSLSSRRDVLHRCRREALFRRRSSARTSGSGRMGATRSVRRSTRTESATTCGGCSSATARSCRGRCRSIRR